MPEQFTNGHAIIVGVGADLPNTVDDAIGLADIIKDPVRCAYPHNQVHLLTAKQATRDAILSALDILAHSADSQSTTIVYFSGHGYQISSTAAESYYLMPYGYDTHRLDRTAISGAEFADRLKAIAARKLVVMLDCCHAGGIDEAKSSDLQMVKAPLPTETLSLFAEGSGRVIIASSRAEELSYGGKPYSAFTLALIEALCGIGVTKQDGYVRVVDLALHAREVVPGRTNNRQHPILNFEQADNFILAYYAGSEIQPKDLPFTNEPEIEPTPGAWTAFDQREQTVHGSQTNIADDAHGPVLSGSFQGPVEIGRQERVNTQGGFYQPGWTIHGNVNQAQRDIVIASGDVNQSGEALARIFADAMERIKVLPADDQEVVKPIAQQARILAEKLQQGDETPETQGALEKRLKNLRAMTSDIGDVVIATLASPAAGIAMVIRKIAEKVQEEVKEKNQ